MKNNYDIYNNVYRLNEYFDNNISMCIPSDKYYIRDRFLNEIYLLMKNVYKAYFNKKEEYNLLIECLVNIAILDSLTSSIRKCIKDKKILNKTNNISYYLGNIKNKVYSWKTKFDE